MRINGKSLIGKAFSKNIMYTQKIIDILSLIPDGFYLLKNQFKDFGFTDSDVCQDIP